MLSLVSTSASSLPISLEVAILASAVLTHCNDLRTHCNLSSLVKHYSKINSFSVAVGEYECVKTKPVSILHFFFRVNRELLVLLGARVFRDAMAQRYKPSWMLRRLCLAMLRNGQKAFWIFPPMYNNFDLFWFVTLSTRKNLNHEARGRTSAAFLCRIDN